MSIYEHKVKTIDGREAPLSDYQGKVLLIVNVASRCGFTPQYLGLEQLYKAYQSKGFEILGFPCNQFGSQEPGSDTEIKNFCEMNYQITFPMFSKIEVNGKEAHPLYQDLKSHAKGLLGSESIKWNFTKFLVDRSGKIVKRFAPTEKPESLKSSIEALL
jgi:glutathione peroxidase